MAEQKNYIPQVAEMLGVKLYEEFSIRLTERGEKIDFILDTGSKFRFDDRFSFISIYCTEWTEVTNAYYLYGLIMGFIEIVKEDD